MITIALVEVDNYRGRGTDYVTALMQGAWCNLFGVEHRFALFTDRPWVYPYTTFCGAPLDVIEVPAGLEGWWAKLYLFAPGVLEGRVLYMDLDSLVVGRLHDIVAYDGRFAILEDFYRGKHTAGAYGSGVMAWEAGTVDFLWTDWLAAGQPMPRGGDQRWIEQRIGLAVDLWQHLFPGAFLSFKADHLADRPLPAEARVVSYHGKPKPDNCGSELAARYWRPIGLVEIDHVSSHCEQPQEG